jgi:hypothetical protein
MPNRPLPERLRRAPHLAQRRLGDEVVVLDPRRGTIFGLNPAAGELLDWLKPGRRLEGAPGAEAFPPATVEFLAELVELGLAEDTVETEEAAPPPSLFAGPPALLWREAAARVVNQVSPPQAITNPQCQP